MRVGAPENQNNIPNPSKSFFFVVAENVNLSTVDYQRLDADSTYLMMVDKGYFRGNQSKATINEKP